MLARQRDCGVHKEKAEHEECLGFNVDGKDKKSKSAESYPASQKQAASRRPGPLRSGI
jgi:hypothetical protein